MFGSAALFMLIGYFADDGERRIPWLVLSAILACASIYCWAEVTWTKGFFDDTGMGFQSIWRGRRYYRWAELSSVSFSASANWYVLRFDRKKPARISVVLYGHGELLAKLKDMGFEP